MNKSNFRVIKLFGKEKPKFIIYNELADFEKRPDKNLYIPKVDYNKLFSNYGITPTDFKERVANLINPNALESKDNEDLMLNWVTSVDILAAGAGYFSSNNPFFQLAAIGVLETKDNQIVLGIRGGEITPERVERFASGLYGLPPGGSVTFKPSYENDPLTDTILEEFLEEVGNFEIKSQELLGVFEAFKPGPTGIKFVSRVSTNASLKQIQKTNIQANNFYNKLIKRGASRKDVKEELKNKGLPPDAWEHFPMIGIPKDSIAIRHFIQTQHQSFPGISSGSLTLYSQSLESCVYKK